MIDTLKTQEGKFLLIVLLVALFIGIKVIRLPQNSEIGIEIMQNKGAIVNLDSAKVVSHTKRLKIPTLKFEQSRSLIHASLGELGFKSNFFINATTYIQVLKKGLYTFKVTSDDGFRLKIDDKLVCEFIGDRGYETNTCKYTLSNGSHLFNLSYYQGGGPMGLKVTYRLASKSYLIGEDSKYLEFKANE